MLKNYISQLSNNNIFNYIINQVDNKSLILSFFDDIKITQKKIDLIIKFGFDYFENYINQLSNNNINKLFDHSKLKKQILICSDIDDTIIDRKYDGYVFYTGVADVFKNLSDLPVFLLTARLPQYSISTQNRMKEGIYNEVILLPGQYSDRLFNDPNRFNDRLANTKFNNFIRIKKLFPELILIFFGDNGQGDVIAANNMQRYDPSSIIFIHNVTNAKIDQSLTSINYFNNYLDVAKILHNMQLINDFQFNNIKTQFQ
jgi:hypothetical protein